MTSTFVKRCGLAFGVFLTLALQVQAGVPLDTQVAIFKKVIKFDSTLEGMDPIPVLVVRGADAAIAKDVSDTLKGAGFGTAIVDATSFSKAKGAAKVVYFCPDALDSATGLPPGVLSLCGSPEAVEANAIALGVELLDGKPKLVVSLAAYTASGHDISGQVLGLARIIR